MKQKYFKNIYLLNAYLVFYCLSTNVQANEKIRMGEEYYGNDMNAAVQEAQINQRKVDYNNKYWYNRTTSKSFSLPPLDSSELESAQLEGALQPTAAGNQTASKESDSFLIDPLNLERNENDNSELNIQTTSPNIDVKPVNIIPDIQHQFTRGDKVETRSIISTGTVTSTPRP